MSYKTLDGYALAAQDTSDPFVANDPISLGKAIGRFGLEIENDRGSEAVLEDPAIRLLILRLAKLARTDLLEDNPNEIQIAIEAVRLRSKITPKQWTQPYENKHHRERKGADND